MKPRIAIAVTAAIVLGSFAYTQTFSAPAVAQDNATGLKIGDKVEAFTLPDPAGKQVTVGDWGSAKATVILYVATKCPISNDYNERMANLATAYTPKNVRFYGINSNKAELSPEIAEHAKANKLTFPVLKDAGNVIADRFGAKVTPEAYVVDPTGKLVYWGHVDDSQKVANVKQRGLADALDALVEGKPVAVSQTRAFGCTIKREKK